MDSTFGYNGLTVHRAWLALAVLVCTTARGQAPAYSVAGIVNAANFAPGPFFAANSVVTIFGTNLSNASNGVSANQVPGGTLPTSEGMAGTSVYVANMPVPLLYVSADQVNFLIPTNLIPGTVPVRVVKQGLTGPEVKITLVPGAPALFTTPDGYIIAEDWNAGYAVIASDAPAHAGDLVIVYATGLGAAGQNATGFVPASAVPIDNLASLNVYVNGVAVNRSAILYAGLTPGFAGLYQINLLLPADCGPDPEIRVAIGSQESPPGSKLYVR